MCLHWLKRIFFAYFVLLTLIFTAVYYLDFFNNFCEKYLCKIHYLIHDLHNYHYSHPSIRNEIHSHIFTNYINKIRIIKLVYNWPINIPLKYISTACSIRTASIQFRTVSHPDFCGRGFLGAWMDAFPKCVQSLTASG